MSSSKASRVRFPDVSEILYAAVNVGMIDVCVGSVTCCRGILSDQTRRIRFESIGALCCAAHGVPPKDHRPCYIIRNLLTRAECESVLNIVNQRHYPPSKPEGGEHYPGSRSNFSLETPALTRLISERLASIVPRRLDGGKFVGFRDVWQHVRYYEGNSLFNHIDQRQNIYGDDDVTASRLSLTVYLDDDYEGGELGFVILPDPSADALLFSVGGTKAVFESYKSPHIKFRPQQGDAVMFYQEAIEFSHCVYPLTRGTKTIARTDAMYRISPAASANAC